MPVGAKTATSILLIVFWAVCPPSSAASPSSELERVLLERLYNSTSGWRWTKQWNTTIRPCDYTGAWYGVNCSSYPNGQITRLSLVDIGMSGSIASELGGLTALVSIDLRWNSLNGFIPSELGQLTSLTAIRLDRNQLRGNLSTFTKSTALTYLGLQQNLFTGTIPDLSLLSSLQYLYLHLNMVSGSIPSGLANLTQLRAIYLRSASRLSGTLPAQLSSLTRLANLNFEVSRVSGILPSELGLLTSLYLFASNSNRMSGSIPSEFSSFTWLRYLSLQGNSYSGTLPSELSTVTSLSVLYIHVNAVSGTIHKDFRKLSKLVNWYVYSNKLSGTIPNLSNLTSLQIFLILNNKFSGTLSQDLTNMTSLVQFQAYANRFSGTLPQISKLKHLIILYLHQNQLSGTIGSEVLFNISKLARFYVSNNKISGTLSTQFSNMTSLTHILASTNRINGTIPRQFSKLTRLTYLFLHANSLSGTIASELSSLGSLAQLILYTNSLSGTLPSELSSLGSVNTVQLFSNSLSGTIASQLSSLGNLAQLFLQSNSLSGTIASELSSLASLQRLYLQGMNFSGTLPNQLSSLAALSRLSVFNNNINGTIPKQFSSLTRLVEIDLRSNALSGTVASELSSLSRLQLLSVSSNTLSGCLPSELSRLPQLTTLAICPNELSGSVPAFTALTTTPTSDCLYTWARCFNVTSTTDNATNSTTNVTNNASTPNVTNATNSTTAPTASPTTVAPALAAGTQAAQATAVCATVLVSKLLSTSVGVTPPTSIMTTMAISAYSKDDPEARSLAGVMSPVLFLLPTLDPLYPAESSSRRSEDSGDSGTVKFFGLDALAVEPRSVYLWILAVSSLAYWVVFALLAGDFNANVPRAPGHETCKIRLSDALLCCLFASTEFDLSFLFDVEIAGDIIAAGADADIIAAGADADLTEVVATADTTATTMAVSASGTGSGSGLSPTAPVHPAARLWPLAVMLFFVVGQAQFAGLMFALVYAIAMAGSQSIATWACFVAVSVGFPAVVIVVCWTLMPTVVADRLKRQEGSEWAEVYDEDSERSFYYNVRENSSQWEEPEDYQPDGCIPTTPLEVCYGIECLVGSYHGDDLISRFYPVLQLLHEGASVAMVTTYYWSGSHRAAWLLTGLETVLALLTTWSMPLIDQSTSQRNAENYATAAALWLMSVALGALTVDMYETVGSTEQVWQRSFTCLSLMASLVVPVVCYLDDKFLPEEDEDDEGGGGHNKMESNPLAAPHSSGSEDDASAGGDGKRPKSDEDPERDGWWLDDDANLVAFSMKRRSTVDFMRRSEEHEDRTKQDSEPQEIVTLTTVQKPEEKRFTKADAKAELQQWKRLRDTGELSLEDYKAKKAELRRRRFIQNKPPANDLTVQI